MNETGGPSGPFQVITNDSVDYRRRQKAAERWDDPIDILGQPELSGRPVLDRSCCPETLLRFAHAEGNRLSADPIGIVACAIGVCSSVITDDWRIRLKIHDLGWMQSPRLWVMLLAQPGSKKTDQINEVMRPVERIEGKLRQDHEQQMARHINDHTHWKKHGKKNGDPEPKPPAQKRLMSSDFTPESLSDILAKGARKLLLHQDELSAFFGSFERYSGSTKMSSGRAHMLSAYEGGRRQIDRVMRGAIYVPNWSVCIVGGIQPDRLRSSVEDLGQDGLLQRFMMVDSPALPPTEDDDKPTDWEAVDAYARLVEDLYELQPHFVQDGRPAPVHAATADAKRITELRRSVFRVIERIEVDKQVPAGLRQTAAKWRGTLARLSLVFHCIRLAERGIARESQAWTRLEPETVAMAARFILGIVLPAAFGFYLSSDDHAGGSSMTHARWIAGHLLAHRKEKITLRDVSRASVGLRGRHKEILAAMSVLIDMGWVEAVHGAKVAWEVNPAVHQRFAVQAATEKQRRDRVREMIRESVSDRVNDALDELNDALDDPNGQVDPDQPV